MISRRELAIRLSRDEVIETVTAKVRREFCEDPALCTIPKVKFYWLDDEELEEAVLTFEEDPN